MDLELMDGDSYSMTNLCKLIEFKVMLTIDDNTYSGRLIALSIIKNLQKILPNWYDFFKVF